MNTKIKTLAANIFAPINATPQELKFENDEPAEVGEIKQLNYPQLYTLSVGGKCWSRTYRQVFTEVRVKKGDTVKPGGILGLTRGHLTHHLNAVKAYTFESDLERAELLLEIIKQWAGKSVECFCNGEGALWCFDYKKWLESDEKIDHPLGWKDPSSCSSCKTTQEILKAVLGRQNAPFITSLGSRCFSINLTKLMTFVKEGPEALAVAEKKKREQEAKAERQRYEDDVTKALQGAEVSDVIRTGLVEFRAGRGYWDGVKVVSKDLVVSFGPRSEYGSVGGIGKFDEVRVWYKGQVARQEWKWRDQYNPNADRFDLRVGGIGKVTVKSKEGEVEVKVEIQNGDDSRFATYAFEDKEVQAQPGLSTEEQALFEQRFGVEVERVLGTLMELMPLKPRMLLESGEGTYRQPTIKQRVLHASQGVGAFVTEEQIDHLGTDRQIQFKLFVFGAKDKTARMLSEDHAYEQRQKISPVITVVDMTPEKVVINTRHGSKTINLS